MAASISNSALVIAALILAIPDLVAVTIPSLLMRERRPSIGPYVLCLYSTTFARSVLV